MKSFEVLICWIVLLLAISCSGHALVLFQENWSSSSIDQGKWTVLGGSTYSSLVSTGGGDYALRVSGSGDYTEGVRSILAFPRGDNLRCTFMLWRDSGDWSYNSVCGPFANRNSLEGTYPTLCQIEAGIVRYHNSVNSVGWGEGVTEFLNIGPLVESDFVQAWTNATSRSTAIHVRVTLGNDTGALCEWSTDGTNWQVLRLAQGSVPIDTRGLPAGSDWNGVYTGGDAACKVSSADQVWIFFGGAYAGSFIDNIIVENDVAAPTPTPIPQYSWLTDEFLMPEGTLYDATVPDTLDLAERARIAVQGLTNFLNPARNYEPYGQAYFYLNPPYMSQIAGSPGPPNWGKIGDAIIMTRRMCGSDYNLTVEREMLKGMLNFSGNYQQTEWITPLTRMMLAMITLYEQEPTAEVEQIIRSMIRIHLQELTFSGDFAFYVDPPFDNNGEWLGISGYVWQPFISGTALRALCHWYLLSGDSAIVEPARKMANFLLQTKFWQPESTPKAVVGSDKAQFMGHHHAYTQGLLGLLYYARISNNSRIRQFVRDGYEFSRNFGLCRLGVFGEACTTGDMTFLAIKMSEWGMGDYWEDVDCYVRNHLAELQITDENHFVSTIQSMPPNTRVIDPQQETINNVGPRNVGVFLSDSSHPTLIPSGQYISPDLPAAFTWTICCTGNCTAALYHAWKAIVSHSADSTKINLLLNRASPWLDMDSYLPFEGKVVIRNKISQKIYVRIPRWVSREDVSVLSEGQNIPLRWIGNYLDVGNVDAGDEVVIEFPMVDSLESYTLKWKQTDFWKESVNPGNSWTPSANPDQYSCRFRGNTLVDINPRSTLNGYALYRRNAMRDSTVAPMKTVTRFVESGQTFDQTALWGAY